MLIDRLLHNQSGKPLRNLFDNLDKLLGTQSGNLGKQVHRLIGNLDRSSNFRNPTRTMFGSLDRQVHRLFGSLGKPIHMLLHM